MTYYKLNMNKYISFYYLLNILILFIVTSANARSETVDTIKISDDLVLLKISDNTYIHISYLISERMGRIPCNGLIYITEDNAYIMDTPISDEVTLELITWLKDEMKVTVAGVIVNHWHVDCMGGLNQVHNSGIKSYAHELTCEIAASKNLPVPEHSFKDSLLIKSDEKEIICKYFGGGHTKDNIVVWIPEEKILFGGCMVKSISSVSLGNTRDADVESWPVTIERVLNRFGNARIVVPGHGSHGGTELLANTLRLLKDNSTQTLE